MPGAQAKVSRYGSWTEILVEACLKTIAFTVRVPHEDDVGHDFFCVLSEPLQNGSFKAGPSFTVQAKSSGAPVVVLGTEYAIAWLKELQNPFFVAVGNREEQRVEVYSTWCRFNGFLRLGENAAQINKITLQPGPPTCATNPCTSEDGSEQVIALGEPIIRAEVKEFMDEGRAKEFGEILGQWIRLDRTNIVNVENGMYWITGPKSYRTNERLPMTGDALSEGWLWTYFHLENVGNCERHFARAATGLRVALHHLHGSKEAKDTNAADKIRALEGALSVYGEHLDVPCREALRQWVGFVPKGRSGACTPGG